MSFLVSEICEPPAVAPARAETLGEILRRRALAQPTRRAFTYLADGEAEEAALTFEELDARAGAVAALLREHCRRGDRALLLYPPGLDFVAAFFGCLYAGVVAVPAYPPHPSRLSRTLPKLRAIAADARPAVLLTTSKVLALAPGVAEQAPDFGAMRWLATDGLGAEPWKASAVDEDGLAFLQYTSGSTGQPKGVMVTHRNLAHNSAYLAQGFRHGPADVLVTWLPTYHDMGLIYGILQPVFTGFECYVMPPAAFIQRPSRWLRAMSRYGATHGVAPNFAYDLCARKVTAELRDALDLSRWRVAVNGAEPIRRETLERFAEAFAPCGFRRAALHPGYGLAEATLKVSGGRAGRDFVTCVVRAGEMERHRVVEAAESDADARTLVGSGRAGLGVEIAIVNPETFAACAHDEVGEIWVRGESVARGYWGRPEASRQTFGAHTAGGAGPYLRTGDLGFLRGGELFVTGRLKDLIIVGGANYYPQDLELTAESSHPCLRPGGAAAFSVEADSAERLVVAAEVERRLRPGPSGPAAKEIVTALRRAISEEHELQVHEVVLLRAGTLPKTSSGKVQRQACRAKFMEASLEVWGG